MSTSITAAMWRKRYKNFIANKERFNPGSIATTERAYEGGFQALERAKQALNNDSIITLATLENRYKNFLQEVTLNKKKYSPEAIAVAEKAFKARFEEIGAGKGVEKIYSKSNIITFFQSTKRSKEALLRDQKNSTPTLGN